MDRESPRAVMVKKLRQNQKSIPYNFSVPLSPLETIKKKAAQ
jgi:hypothetical protein